jgi:hypothetical protein
MKRPSKALLLDLPSFQKKKKSPQFFVNDSGPQKAKKCGSIFPSGQEERRERGYFISECNAT